MNSIFWCSNPFGVIQSHDIQGEKRSRLDTLASQIREDATFQQLAREHNLDPQTVLFDVYSQRDGSPVLQLQGIRFSPSAHTPLENYACEILELLSYRPLPPLFEARDLTQAVRAETPARPQPVPDARQSPQPNQAVQEALEQTQENLSELREALPTPLSPDLNARIEQLQRENAELQQQLEALNRASHQAVTQLRDEAIHGIDAIQYQRNYYHELASQYLARLAVQQLEIDQLKDQLLARGHELSSMQTDRDTLHRELTALPSQITHLLSVQGDLLRQLETAREETAEAHRQINDFEIEHERAAEFHRNVQARLLFLMEERDALSGQIANLESQIGSLQNEFDQQNTASALLIQSLATDLEALEAEKRNAQEQLQALAHERDVLSNRTSALESQIASLSGELAASTARAAEAEADRDAVAVEAVAAQERINILQEETAEAHRQINDFEIEHERALAFYQEVQESFASLTQERDALEAENRNAQGQLQALAHERDALLNRTSVLESQIASLRGELAASQEQVVAQEAARADAAAQAAAAQRQIDTLKADLQRSRTALEEKTRELATTSDLIASLRGELAEAETARNAAAAQAITAQNQIGALEAELQRSHAALEEKDRELTTQKNASDARIDALAAQLAALQRDIDASTAQASAAEASRDTAVAQAAAAQRQIAALAAELEGSRATLERKTQELAASAAQLTALQLDLAHSTAQVTAKEAARAAAVAQIAAAQEQIDDLKADLEGSRAALEEKTQEFAALQAAKDTSDARITALITQLESARQASSAAEAARAAAAAKTAAAQEQIEALNAALERSRTALEGKTQELTELQAAKGTSDARIDALTTQLESARQASSAAESRAADLETTIAANRLQLEQLQRERRSLEEQLAITQATLQTTQATVASKQSKIDEQMALLRDLASTLSSQRETLNSISRFNDELAAENAALKAEKGHSVQTITSYQRDLSALAERVSELERLLQESKHRLTASLDRNHNLEQVVRRQEDIIREAARASAAALPIARPTTPPPSPTPRTPELRDIATGRRALPPSVISDDDHSSEGTGSFHSVLEVDEEEAPAIMGQFIENFRLEGEKGNRIRNQLRGLSSITEITKEGDVLRATFNPTAGPFSLLPKGFPIAGNLSFGGAFSGATPERRIASINTGAEEIIRAGLSELSKSDLSKELNETLPPFSKLLFDTAQGLGHLIQTKLSSKSLREILLQWPSIRTFLERCTEELNRVGEGEAKTALPRILAAQLSAHLSERGGSLILNNLFALEYLLTSGVIKPGDRLAPLILNLTEALRTIGQAEPLEESTPARATATAAAASASSTATRGERSPPAPGSVTRRLEFGRRR